MSISAYIDVDTHIYIYTSSIYNDRMHVDYILKYYITIGCMWIIYSKYPKHLNTFFQP